MEEQLANLIKENKGILRQLTYLNNEVKKLKGRIFQLEQKDSYYPNVEEIRIMPVNKAIGYSINKE